LATVSKLKEIQKYNL